MIVYGRLCQTKTLNFLTFQSLEKSRKGYFDLTLSLTSESQEKVKKTQNQKYGRVGQTTMYACLEKKNQLFFSMLLWGVWGATEKKHKIIPQLLFFF